MIKAKGFTPDLIKIFINEFQVARNFRWALREENETATVWATRNLKAKEDFLPLLAIFLNDLPDFKPRSLEETYLGLEKIVLTDSGIKVLWGRTQVRSALSKFYMAHTGWKFPPYDSYSGRKLNVGRSSPLSAESYFAKLDKMCFETKVEILARNLPADFEANLLV